MLRTRLWMGSLLIAWAMLLLGEASWFAPIFPLFLITFLAAGFFAVRELLSLIDATYRPDYRLCLCGVEGIVLLNAIPHLLPFFFGESIPTFSPWQAIGIAWLGIMAVAFLREMWIFEGPNQIVPRVALTGFAVMYLGVLPSFLMQMRWLPGVTASGIPLATLAIALTVFVPKCCDIGAYFTGKFLTGRILGRHPMTPKLSPKKTWQGAIGGVLASILTAILIGQLGPLFGGSYAKWVGFGLTVGIAGMLGDLAESLIKRDGQMKDASQSIPGFGGVLDVIDSLLFAAPIAYWWFL